jgi:small subunit ribosomal protein S16
MLSIRMQRTGRKGHAMFRVIVQESRLTPTSGKVVAFLGSYDPHAKTVTLDKEKAATFLKNGAQPSDRAALLMQKEGVKLPKWVKVSSKKSGAIRNPEKLRRNNPVEATKEEAPAEAEAPEEVAEAPAEAVAETEDAPEAETGTTEA